MAIRSTTKCAIFLICSWFFFSFEKCFRHLQIYWVSINLETKSLSNQITMQSSTAENWFYHSKHLTTDTHEPYQIQYNDLFSILLFFHIFVFRLLSSYRSIFDIYRFICARSHPNKPAPHQPPYIYIYIVIVETIFQITQRHIFFLHCNDLEWEHANVRYWYRNTEYKHIVHTDV